jgi:curved DNA-binding protein CbpA
MTRTFYDVLGVGADADQEEIKRSYRRLAKEHHPDVSDEPAASERFKNISRAADVLTDPAERRRYDRLGHDSYVASARRDGDTSSAWTEAATATDTAATDNTTTRETDATGTATGQADATTGERQETTTGRSGRATTDAGRDDTAGPTGGYMGAAAADTGARSDPNGSGSGTRRTAAAGDIDPENLGAMGDTVGGTGPSPGATTAGETTDHDTATDPTAGEGVAWGPPEDTVQWDHDSRATEDSHGGADRRADRRRRNWWLLALSLIGSGRFVDQWAAFRLGAALVYTYPILLLVVAANISPVVTTVAGIGVLSIALYASGIPNVGLFVFGLPGGLFTVFLLESPEYTLTSGVGIVLMAGSWLPLAHAVLVAVLLVRS